ncbi:hypothetical protein [Nitrobacter sp.]|jgi:antitoxin component of MazEF toxin-antitoxin module|uniref:hypothetical protein n=1 Tax=Nitrobacter sp. TaxID=29420 RepID=UPI003F64CC08
MPKSLADAIKAVTADDLHIDAHGRLLITNPELARQIAEAAPNLRRIAGAEASNNCSCGGGSGCGSMPALDVGIQQKTRPQ